MTVIPFLPTTSGPFEFQATLDGSQYSGLVAWGLVGRRYYLNLFSLAGDRLFTLPLIGSPDAVALETVTWSQGIVTVTTTTPHAYLLGATVDLTVSGMSPDGYNGDVRAFITGRSEFQYPLAGDPGDAAQLGASVYNINIAAGYFTTSKLIFRESSQQFEIVP
jgi:hypothetical protein